MSSGMGMRGTVSRCYGFFQDLQNCTVRWWCCWRVLDAFSLAEFFVGILVVSDDFLAILLFIIRWRWIITRRTCLVKKSWKRRNNARPFDPITWNACTVKRPLDERRLLRAPRKWLLPVDMDIRRIWRQQMERQSISYIRQDESLAKTKIMITSNDAWPQEWIGTFFFELAFLCHLSLLFLCRSFLSGGSFIVFSCCCTSSHMRNCSQIRTLV